MNEQESIILHELLKVLKQYDFNEDLSKDIKSKISKNIALESIEVDNIIDYLEIIECYDKKIFVDFLKFREFKF